MVFVGPSPHWFACLLANSSPDRITNSQLSLCLRTVIQMLVITLETMQLVGRQAGYLPATWFTCPNNPSLQREGVVQVELQQWQLMSRKSPVTTIRMRLCGVVVIPSDFEYSCASEVPTTPVRTRARPDLFIAFYICIIFFFCLL